jgi:hypothetical protein
MRQDFVVSKGISLLEECGMLQLLVSANAVPSSLIFSTLTIEAIHCSQRSVLRATRRHIPEEDILHSHRRENLKIYDTAPLPSIFVTSLTLDIEEFQREHTVTYTTDVCGVTDNSTTRVRIGYRIYSLWRFQAATDYNY